MIIPLRQSPTRKFFAIGTWLALGMIAAQAQEAGGAPPRPAGSDVIETVAAVVYGLSSNDLLNVRATASPIGLVLARIPNGTIVTRLECSISRSAEWCRIEVPELDGLVGWTPARYLLSPGADDEAEAPPPAPLPGPSVVDPSKVTVGILPDPLPRPEDPLADAAPGPAVGGPELQTALLAPAPDGPPSFDAAREAEKIEGAAAELALAFATRTDPAASAVYSAFEAEAAPGAEGTQAPAGTALAVPVPSPRPPRADEEEPVTATVAALPSPDPAATQETPAATDLRDAPAGSEADAPAAVAPQAPSPALDPGSPPAAAPETAAAAAEAPAPPQTAPLSAQQPAVALALPPDVPDELASASPDAEDVGRTPVSAPLPSAEPVAEPGPAGEAPRTLREQLAALLPSWSRPPAGPPAEPAPEQGPEAAAPPAVPAAAAGSSEGEGDAEPAPAHPGERAEAAGTSETAAAAARPESAATTVPGPAGQPAPARIVPSEGAAGPASSRPEDAADVDAEATMAEPPAPAVVPMPVMPEPAAEPRRIETIAQAQPAEPTPALSPAEGEAAEIPCARYVGQPMTRCEVRILRLSADDADVTVLWPDGGERLIRFRGGEPDGTNTRGEFRFTREAELNLIRIGSGERFEILDALPFAE